MDDDSGTASAAASLSGSCAQRETPPAGEAPLSRWRRRKASPRGWPSPHLAVLLLPALASCASLGQAIADAMRERPPAARSRMTVASDARLDSLGRLEGSFVGEGTARAVHLVSTDTALIADLVRQYAPNIRRTTDFWTGVRRASPIRIPIRDAGEPADRGVLLARTHAASPAGRSAAEATSLIIRSGYCGGYGLEAELIVEPSRRDGPPLTGPAVANVRPSGARLTDEWREPLPEPDSTLVFNLIDWSRRTMDSLLARSYRSIIAKPVPEVPVLVNTLADLDAAEVAAYRAGDGRIRYAVSLRERRVAGRDTLIATGVFAFDAAGTWRQVIFQPLYLGFARGRLGPRGGDDRYWRRLVAVDDFSFDRDNLWIEQVDARTGRVVWGIIQPADNVIVAAAEMCP